MNKCISLIAVIGNAGPNLSASASQHHGGMVKYCEQGAEVNIPQRIVVVAGAACSIAYIIGLNNWDTRSEIITTCILIALATAILYCTFAKKKGKA